jgi:hypothetical protein
MSYLTDLKEKSDKRKLEKEKAFKEGKKGCVMLIIGAILFYFFGGSLSTCNESKDTNKAQVITYYVTPKEVLELYKENEVAADNKFKDKVCSVTGSINEIRKDYAGDVVIELKAKEYYTVNFSMKNDNGVSELHPNNEITIVGTCSGMVLGVVYFSDCELSQ